MEMQRLGSWSDCYEDTDMTNRNMTARELINTLLLYDADKPVWIEHERRYYPIHVVDEIRSIPVIETNSYTTTGANADGVS
jgi:hypothetical protein